MTQTTPSSINIFAKPLINQIAYAGYKANIEAFLFATAVQQKVSTITRSYPLNPVSVNISIPFPAPSIAFKLANSRPSASFQKTFDSAVAKVEGRKSQSGKTTIYTIPSCKPNPLLSFHKVADENPIYVENHMTTEAAMHYKQINAFIELFLRVHIYEAIKEEGFPSATGRIEVWNGAKKEKITRDATEADLKDTYRSVKKMKVCLKKYR